MSSNARLDEWAQALALVFGWERVWIAFDGEYVHGGDKHISKSGLFHINGQTNKQIRTLIKKRLSGDLS